MKIIIYEDINYSYFSNLLSHLLQCSLYQTNTSDKHCQGRDIDINIYVYGIKMGYIYIYIYGIGQLSKQEGLDKLYFYMEKKHRLRAQLFHEGIFQMINQRQKKSLSKIRSLSRKETVFSNGKGAGTWEGICQKEWTAEK